MSFELGDDFNSNELGQCVPDNLKDDEPTFIRYAGIADAVERCR